MPYFEVTYYKKVVRFQKVEAATKAEAREIAYRAEKAKENDALHQFTVHRVDETRHDWRECKACGGTGYLPSQGEYCQPICTACNCLGLTDDHILR